MLNLEKVASLIDEASKKIEELEEENQKLKNELSGFQKTAKVQGEETEFTFGSVTANEFDVSGAKNGEALLNRVLQGQSIEE